MKKIISKSHRNFFPLLRGFLVFATLTSFMVLFPAAAFSETVTLAWDANTESDLKGYVLYYGTSSGNYSNDIDVGNTTQYTTPDLQDGVTYYFVVTAYNEADHESDFSKELAHTVGVSNNFPSTPVMSNSPSNGYIDISYNFNASASDPDGDSLEYQYDWDDGTQSTWGADSNSHAWSAVGTYCIKARARDIYGALSGWSDCHSITVAELTHTITASAGSQGSIAPSGNVEVVHGSSQTFTISSKYVPSGYGEENDSSSGKIWLEAEIGSLSPPMEIGEDADTSSGQFIYVPPGNGTITDPLQVGGYAEYTFSTAVSGEYVIWGRIYAIDGGSNSFYVSVDGTEYVDWHTQVSNIWVWDQLLDDNDVDPLTYYLEPGQHTLIVKQREPGTKIDRILITRSEESDHQVQDILIDGNSVGAVNSYTFDRVTASHTIEAVFTQVASHTITASAGAYGSISPTGTVTVDQGSDITFTITADPDYQVAAVWVDGSSLGAVSSYTFENVNQNHTISASFEKEVVVDSDGDGVPDDRDDFPYDADESLDTDGDGEGNNADTDDDNDGMPDDWELTYGLDPLVDDADGDPDGDDVSNINEYNLGTAPNHYEGNFKPESPVLLMPENGAAVSLTPQLDTDKFADPNTNDDHAKTQWMVVRAFDDVCVFDVTSKTSLTSLSLPKHILEEDTEYIWQARFFDNHDTPSGWSEQREFSTGFADYDTDKNGVPDAQEVSDTLDLDADGTVDRVQSDIRCVSAQDGDDEVQICVSIKGAQNAHAILTLQVQDPADLNLNSAVEGKPNYFEFGLLDFKLLVTDPGDETTVTIYLSKPAFTEGNCFKYDPVNGIWLDYSGYTDFSPNRQEVYLTLKDGGFGDADGIENGIIVDPLAFGSETDPSGGGSDSAIEEVVDGIIPDQLSCFITTTAARLDNRKSRSLWREIQGREPAIIFVLVLAGFIAKVVFAGVRRNRNVYY